MMDSVGQIIKNSKKIVVKLGSNVLSGNNGKADMKRIQNITSQLVDLIKMGKQVVIVSSGAGIYGVSAIDKWSRKDDINYKQALCSIGQVELMMAYKKTFAEYGIQVGQILLTRTDFEDNIRSLNIRNTLFTLVDEGVVPIVNENDSVSVEEIKIGDNDTLSAYTTTLWNGDCLIILSDIDGIYSKNPKINKDAVLINKIGDIEDLRKNIETEGKSSFGTGGIVCKINAAEKVNKYNIPMILLNGTKENILTEALTEENIGTVFLDKKGVL